MENFPFVIQDLEPDSSTECLWNIYGEEFVKIGPKKYFLPKSYKNVASKYYNMEVRESDICVASHPRSGTTWTQELVWMVTNDMDYKEAQIPLTHRYYFIEKEVVGALRKNITRETKATAYLKTHLPLSLLPPDLLESAKMVYVARDPRDVAVSRFNFAKLFGYSADLKTFWNMFITNIVVYNPYFEHVKEAWNMRHHPNMLFLFYEDLSQDLPAVIRRVSEFFGNSYREDQVQRLAQHLAFKNFTQNKAVNNPHSQFVHDFQNQFIRKGKVGGWREHFDEEMVEQAENWITENLKDSDLKYPHYLENEQHEK